MIINGISTKKYKDRDWDSYRNHTIGFVFQSYNLIPHQTILANVELALTISGVSKSKRREKAIKALKQVGLANQIHKKTNQLSGGQMQRVAIARALVNDPDIVLADEPTGALDSDTSIQVMELLKKVAKDRLVVMVTPGTNNEEDNQKKEILVGYEKYVNDNELVSVEDLNKYIVEYMSSDKAKDIITKNISKIMTSQNLEKQITTIMGQYMQKVMGTISKSLQTQMESSIRNFSKTMTNVISIDENAFMGALKMKMNEEELNRRYYSI